MVDSVPKSKKELLDGLLAQGMVQITINAQLPEVIVPQWLKPDPQLRLNLSYRFGLAMDINDWGVEPRLTFKGSYFDCKIPWPAIYLMVSHVDGKPYFFPNDIPDEQIATSAAIDTSSDKESSASEAGKTDRSQTKTALRLVTANESGETSISQDTTNDDTSPDATPKRGKPNLRLVQ